jgi:hypothetical protein
MRTIYSLSPNARNREHSFARLAKNREPRSGRARNRRAVEDQLDGKSADYLARFEGVLPSDLTEGAEVVLDA